MKDNQYAKKMEKDCSEEKEIMCHGSQGKIMSQEKKGLSSVVKIVNKYQVKKRKNNQQKQTAKVCGVWSLSSKLHRLLEFG